MCEHGCVSGAKFLVMAAEICKEAGFEVLKEGTKTPFFGESEEKVEETDTNANTNTNSNINNTNSNTNNENEHTNNNISNETTTNDRYSNK